MSDRRIRKVLERAQPVNEYTKPKQLVRKGVILAGGLGTRLHPVTKIQSKHLLPVYKNVMIEYPLACFRRAGIRDVLIVTGPEFAGNYIDFLRSGDSFAMNFTYKIQEGPTGIAGALGLAEDFIHNENFSLILGDNIFAHGIDDIVEQYNKLAAVSPEKAMIVLKHVANPKDYGVATFADEDQAVITKITEKPSEPDSTAAVTGLYFYPSNVFEKIKKLKPSKRGELEITDINNMYLKEGTLTHAVYEGYWGDVGSHDGILRTAIELQELSKLNKGIL